MNYILIILAFLIPVIDGIKDDIVHHDAYRYLGKFFSKQAAEGSKSGFFRTYFPMFFDAWHLAKFIQYNCISGIVAIHYSIWWLYPIGVVLLSLAFIIVYESND